jgi:hypothetical protein
MCFFMNQCESTRFPMFGSIRMSKGNCGPRLCESGGVCVGVARLMSEAEARGVPHRPPASFTK